MTEDAKLTDLKTLRLLLELRSVSRAAQVLGCGQPAVSKALLRLRSYFDDPLLVRVGRTMQPTPKAIALREPLAQMLAASEKLLKTVPKFDPDASAREFQVLVTEVGMNMLVPPLAELVRQAGAHLRFRAILLDTRSFGARLEAGEADLAIGSFPDASGSLRRQHLYVDGYSGVVRAGRAEFEVLAKEEHFRKCEHVTVAAHGDGFTPHQQLARVLKATVPPEQVRTHVPSFLAAAFIASRTDMVAVIPTKLAQAVAVDMGLMTFRPPVRLRQVRIDQLWHEHSQQDPGHLWLRKHVHRLFASSS